MHRCHKSNTTLLANASKHLGLCTSHNAQQISPTAAWAMGLLMNTRTDAPLFACRPKGPFELMVALTRGHFIPGDSNAWLLSGTACSLLVVTAWNHPLNTWLHNVVWTGHRNFQMPNRTLQPLSWLISVSCWLRKKCLSLLKLCGQNTLCQWARSSKRTLLHHFCMHLLNTVVAALTCLQHAKNCFNELSLNNTSNFACLACKTSGV